MQMALADVVDKIAQLDALRAISLLPVLVYKLGKSQEPEMQLKVL